MPAAKTGKQQNDAMAARRGARKHETPKHPPYVNIILQCLLEEVNKHGASRQLINKFLTDRYGLEPEAPTTKNAITKAINMGIAHGDFIRLGGWSSKIRLAPKSKKKEAEATTAKAATAKTKSKPRNKHETARGKKATTAKKGKAASRKDEISSDDDDDDDDDTNSGNQSDLSSDEDEESQSVHCWVEIPFLQPRAKVSAVQPKAKAKGKAKQTKATSESKAR